MRIPFNCLSALALVTVLFSSCKKDPPATVTPSAPRSNFHATIGNKNWDSQLSYASIDSGKVSIYGTTLEGKALNLEIAGVAVKTYKVNQFTPSSASYVDSNEIAVKNYDSKVEDQYSGNITITKFDEVKKTISGTFSLVLRNTTDQRLLSVEDGVFSEISYLGFVDTLPDPDNCDYMPYRIGSTFSFNQDGISFDDSIVETVQIDGRTEFVSTEDFRWSCFENFTYFFNWNLTSFDNGDSAVAMKVAKNGMLSGTTWNQQVNSFGDSLTINYVVDAIEPSRVVGGETFTGVFKVNATISGKSNGQPFTNETVTFWMVSGVGLVECSRNNYFLEDYEF